MTWQETYRGYLKKETFKDEVIKTAIEAVERLINEQPLKFRETLEKFLNTWTRDDFKHIGGMVATIQVLSEPMQKTFRMSELFLIERKLSQILQPTVNPIEKVRMVGDARDELRKLMRKAGYKGYF